MSTPSPSGAPKPPPPAIIPVTPLPDILCVPPPPSTMAQSAKRARTAGEEARFAHATTATPNASGSITTFAETLVSEALAKAEVYRSFAAYLDTELPRFSAVSPAHAREAEYLAQTITATLQKSSASPPSPTPDPRMTLSAKPSSTTKMRLPPVLAASKSRCPRNGSPTLSRMCP
ncbi:hypothetical protein SMAC4_13903 [Sordaria macrospora]|uniref:uncharacterized protein n=1 Tax=Sordaria macrospora TaxID=5147 RepID=UPI002B2983AA|nr:hypothetical protein SMAC4_13903 [Sordaria macrospora]